MSNERLITGSLISGVVPGARPHICHLVQALCLFQPIYRTFAETAFSRPYGEWFSHLYMASCLKRRCPLVEIVAKRHI